MPAEAQKIGPAKVHSQTARAPGKKRATLDYATFILNFLTLVAVAIYAYFAYVQSTETVRLANISEKTLTLTERARNLTEAADIELDGIVCSFPRSTPIQNPVFGVDTLIEVVYRNFGKTRGHDVKSQFSIIVQGSRPVSPSAEPSITTLAPGATLRSLAVRVGSAVDDNMLLTINQGRLRLHINGLVTYNDIFGKSHRSEYQTTYMPNTLCGFAIDRNISQ